MTENAARPLIVAVSGGVDSVVLLDMLAAQHLPMVVAHVNHGIRADSDADESHVRSLAKFYELPFESTRLSLDPETSEEAARLARYDWLESVKKSRGASAIATAHHQDDVLETMLINITRGTGWRGLCSLRDTTERYRPLLSLSKAEIIAYAIEHHLDWREDSTNQSLQYLRNRLRHRVMPRLSKDARRKLLELNHAQSELRQAIEQEAERLVAEYRSENGLSRHVLIMCDETVAYELLRAWMGESLEKKRLRDLLVFAKIALPGAKWSLDARRFIVAEATRLIVTAPRD